ncbi:MAG: TetR/AcrR family transcriptional regulator [Streptosporangiales bacterium]
MAETRKVSNPRARAARTKRTRTRRALLAAAEEVFTSKGWVATRIEDVADHAGVSVPTAYQHFRSKHALVAYVYAPRVEQQHDRARRRMGAGGPVRAALEAHVRDLLAMAGANPPLTTALVSAVEEYTIRAGPVRPGDDADPRTIVPLPEVLVELIDRGQQAGEFRPYPPAAEFGPLVVNMVLLRQITRPDEAQDATAEIVLTTAFGVLKPGVLTASGFAGRPFATPR